MTRIEVEIESTVIKARSLIIVDGDDIELAKSEAERRAGPFWRAVNARLFAWAGPMSFECAVVNPKTSEERIVRVELDALETLLTTLEDYPTARVQGIMIDRQLVPAGFMPIYGRVSLAPRLAN